MDFEPINVAEVLDEEEREATRVLNQNARETEADDLPEEEETAAEEPVVSYEEPVVSEPASAPEPEAAEPEPEHKGNTEEIELAIPVRSLEEIIQQAYSAGLDPLVTKDSVTGIDFVDFSDCL